MHPQRSDRFRFSPSRVSVAQCGNESRLGPSAAKSGLEGGGKRVEGELPPASPRGTLAFLRAGPPFPAPRALPRPECCSPSGAGRGGAGSLEEGAVSAPVRVARRQVARRAKQGTRGARAERKEAWSGVGWRVPGGPDPEGGGGGGGRRGRAAEDVPAAVRAGAADEPPQTLARALAGSRHRRRASAGEDVPAKGAAGGDSADSGLGKSRREP